MRSSTAARSTARTSAFRGVSGRGAADEHRNGQAILDVPRADRPRLSGTFGLEVRESVLSGVDAKAEVTCGFGLVFASIDAMRNLCDNLQNNFKRIAT